MQSLVGGLATDATAQYRLHKAMLQQLQYRRPRKYWVLKGFHGFRLAEMFDAYPDATLVWLHRDPVQVAASRTMMMADIAEGMVGPVDLHAEAKKHLEMTRASIANTMSNPMVDDPRILHVRYTDFIADQVDDGAALLRVQRPGVDAGGRRGDADYLADNRGDRHGKFRYSTQLLIDIGENLERCTTNSSHSVNDSASRSRTDGVTPPTTSLGPQRDVLRRHRWPNLHNIGSALGVARLSILGDQLLDPVFPELLQRNTYRVEAVTHIFGGGQLSGDRSLRRKRCPP